MRLVVIAYVGFAISSMAVAQEAGEDIDISLSVWDAVKAGDCQDRMTFLNDEEVLVESGGHAAIKSYELERERRTGFYVLRFETKSRNKELNCAGNQGVRAGQEHGTYIMFNDTADEMTFYSEPDPNSNFNLVFKKR